MRDRYDQQAAKFGVDPNGADCRWPEDDGPGVGAGGGAGAALDDNELENSEGVDEGDDDRSEVADSDEHGGSDGDSDDEDENDASAGDEEDRGDEIFAGSDGLSHYRADDGEMTDKFY